MCELVIKWLLREKKDQLVQKCFDSPSHVNDTFETEFDADVLKSILLQPGDNGDLPSICLRRAICRPEDSSGSMRLVVLHSIRGRLRLMHVLFRESWVLR